jgi:hypothetical protein
MDLFDQKEKFHKKGPPSLKEGGPFCLSTI